MTKSWSDVNAVYQIYPRSFKDTDGDGVGDLRGVTEKLDYISETLGADALWLSPFYPSPQTDCGYDVSDYCAVDPLFGTMADFDNLLLAAHERELKVMIDLVPNHVSDRHAWFQEARASRDNPKRDWFVWRDEPNNWQSISGGSSWQYDETTGQYYLHSFLTSQPDLNWDNPEVRAAVADAMRFWLDKGVDGFRVDAVWGLSKDPAFADDPVNPWHDGPRDVYGAFIHSSSKNGPRLAEYLGSMADVVREYDDRRLLFEYYPDTMLGDMNEQLGTLHAVAPDVAAPFYFEGLHLPWHAEQFGQALGDYLRVVPENAAPSFCFTNHDQPRLVTRYGDEQARLIALLSLTLPGMPVLYNGDEIGLADGVISPELTKDKFDKTGDMGGRDPYRIPVPWSDGSQGDFTTGTPWLPLNADYAVRNIATELGQTDSYLTLYRELLAQRKQQAALRRGSFELIDIHNGYVLAYRRMLGDERWYVVCNFADAEQRVTLPETVKIQVATRPGAVRQDGASITIAGFGAVLFLAVPDPDTP